MKSIYSATCLIPRALNIGNFPAGSPINGSIHSQEFHTALNISVIVCCLLLLETVYTLFHVKLLNGELFWESQQGLIEVRVWIALSGLIPHMTMLLYTVPASQTEYVVCLHGISAMLSMTGMSLALQESSAVTVLSSTKFCPKWFCVINSVVRST
jgi:hypothetical protein